MSDKQMKAMADDLAIQLKSPHGNRHASKVIEQALRDERERCAKIAEKQTVPGSGLYEWGKGANFNAAKIARLIREVTP